MQPARRIFCTPGATQEIFFLIHRETLYLQSLLIRGGVRSTFLKKPYVVYMVCFIDRNYGRNRIYYLYGTVKFARLPVCRRYECVEVPYTVCWYRPYAMAVLLIVCRMPYAVCLMPYAVHAGRMPYAVCRVPYIKSIHAVLALSL